MLSDKFTLLELLDIALGVPQDGTNFNILHTVLTQILLHLHLDSVKFPCQIENEVAARSTILQRRKDYPETLLRRAFLPQKDEKLTEEAKKSVEEKEAESALTKESDSFPESGQIAQLEKVDPQKIAKETLELTKESEKSSEVKGTEPALTKESDSVLDSGQIVQQEKTDPEKVAEETHEVTKSEKSSEVKETEPALTKESDSVLDSGQIVHLEKADARKVAEEILEMAKDTLPEVPTLKEKDLFEDEPAKVIQEMWRATDINRRMGGAEKILGQYADMLDDLFLRLSYLEDSVTELQEKEDDNQEYLDRILKCEEKCKTLDSRIDETILEKDDKIDSVKNSIEDVTQKQAETDSVLQELSKKHNELLEMIAYKKDLEELNGQLTDKLTDKEKELKIRILEVEDKIIPKEDVAEIVSRVDNLSEVKVNREELGPLMEPGFIEKLIEEQKNLKSSIEEIKTTESIIHEELNSIVKKIDEIVKSMDEGFAGVNNTIDTMARKLDLLDADDINDSFARLEENNDKLTEKLKDLNVAVEQFEKEARNKFKTILDLKEEINRLEARKVDKSKLSELLDSKADIEMVSSKLDRDEFVSVIREVKDDLKHLTLVVKVNEEEMKGGFKIVRHELSLKMYTEDFITATEPIRNRIKAMLYEQERIKEIALAHLLPDSPGVLKCFSCKRGANLAGRNSIVAGPERRQFDGNAMPDNDSLKLPPIDIDNVPIPSPNKPKIQDPALLPVLFASATPHVGLVHEKRRKQIDQELENYFFCGGPKKEKSRKGNISRNTK